MITLNHGDLIEKTEQRWTNGDAPLRSPGENRRGKRYIKNTSEVYGRKIRGVQNRTEELVSQANGEQTRALDIKTTSTDI